MQSSSQGRYGYQGYQGYPYVNPMVNDVPTIDAETASKWANLPRRPMQAGSSGVKPGPSGVTSIPQAASKQSQGRDVDENPVVYIDIPEAGSEVSQSIVSQEDEEPKFVQDTIMYDPFENRRIDRFDKRRDDGRSIASSESESTNSGAWSPHPNRPNNFNQAAATSSSQSPVSSYRPPGLPSFMAKESQVYGGDGSDGFPLSPIPISEFPEPPPAYTETPTTAPSRDPPRVEASSPSPPPRTQVIVPEPASPASVGIQSYERKNLICHHCGSRVHSLVVREVGTMTHLIACLVFFIFMPLVIIVYVFDFFKYKNHYCPNCNKLIGYETPMFGQQINYVN